MAATRAIRDAAPDVAVLMLSMHSEETVVRQAMDAGARGYILKNVVDLDLAAAIVRVAAGETVLDQSLVRRSLAGERSRLTRRELEVLQLICDGLSNKDIAARLNVHGFAAHTPRNSNTPVCLSTPTMIIMPSSRKMTFQSMPACAE